MNNKKLLGGVVIVGGIAFLVSKLFKSSEQIPPGNSDLQLAIYDSSGRRVAYTDGRRSVGVWTEEPGGGGIPEGAVYTAAAVVKNNSIKHGTTIFVPATLKIRFLIVVAGSTLADQVFSYAFAAQETKTFTQVFTPNLAALTTPQPGTVNVVLGGPTSDMVSTQIIKTANIAFNVAPTVIDYLADLTLAQG